MTSDSIYAQFASERIRTANRTDGNINYNAQLPLGDVCYAFKVWFRTNWPAIRDYVPDRVVKRELTAVCGQMVNGYWSGLQLVNDN